MSQRTAVKKFCTAAVRAVWPALNVSAVETLKRNWFVVADSGEFLLRFTVLTKCVKCPHGYLSTRTGSQDTAVSTSHDSVPQGQTYTTDSVAEARRSFQLHALRAASDSSIRVFRPLAQFVVAFFVMPYVHRIGVANVFHWFTVVGTATQQAQCRRL